MAKVQAQVRQWRDELIDLTRRNRLLNFNPKRGSSLHITAPTPETIVDRLYAGSGWRFHYPKPDEKESEDVVLLAALEAEDPELDDELRADELLTDELSPAKISRVLHALERRASSEWVDRGLRVLYLAVGKLRWFEVADQELNSPILLIPVSLHRESPREPFWLRATEDDAVLNPALLVKLENDFGIVVPSELDPSDPLSVIDQVRSAVRDQPGWDVSDEVALSYFSFHKESMYQDLKEHEAELCAHPILQTLAGDEVEHVDFAFDPIPDDQLDAVAAPEDLVSILDADSTQRRCIVAARDGRTFVMDGPPGSGKSQTISNMIAELMATGKTVLFVSEKAAALEVVKKRLDDRGLGHYILELHSHKATRKEVAQALGRALTTEPRANGRMSADEIAKARSRRAALTEYAAAQNEVRQPLGRSLHWALGQLELLADAPTAPVPDAVGVDLSAKDLQQIREAAIRLESAWVAVDRSGEFLWRDLTDPPAARRRLGALGQELDSAIGLLTSLRSRADVLTDELLLQPVVTIGGLREIVALTTAIEDRPQNVPPAWLRLETLDEVEQRAQQLKTEAEHHLRRVEALRELAGSACDSLDTHPASEISETLEALAKASPPIDLAPEVTVDAVASLETFLSRLAETSTELNRLSVDVASSLGVKSGDLSPRNAQALAEAAQLSASPHLPESTWFDAQTISAARDAIVLLRPLVEQYEQLGAFITKAFTSDVSAFDVEALYDGPTDLSPNLSRWTSKGRENRRQLKGCVVGGKITDEVKAALPSVRQWKRVDTELQSVELERAPVLGPHYYKRGKTDFDATVAALNVATQAISLVSEQADRVALSRRLSRTSANDRLLAAKGERLLADLHRWREEIRCHLPHGADFDSFPFEQTRDWAVSRLAEVRRLSHALGQVRAVAALDDLGSLRNVAELRRANAETESAIEDRQSVDSVLLGPDYDGLATDWPRVERALDWAKRVRGIHQGPFTERPAEAMCTALINPARIEEDTERYQKYVDSVLDLFNPQQRGVLAADLESLDDAMSTLEELRQTTGQIEVWATYVESRAELVTAGLGEVVGFCEDNTREGVFVPSIIDRAVLTAWVDAVLADDRRCDPILAEQRDRLVSEYRDLDRMLIAHASGRVIESCNARRPRQSVGEPAIIQREATKKTRHRPIRTLLEEAGRAAQSLMPCFMMSPLSVSQFLPASLRFDVVIFDEASQVRPCDAVNSIYRGSQLIVAGDDRQLPPTSFFDRSDNNTDDEYDEDDLEVFESILDLCKGAAGIPALPLLWHYRSRHEDLITYSNRAFYDGKLITYPGAIQEAPDLGIELIHVPDGVYQRGGARDNPIEAKRVVERVIAHAENHPDLTLGVVAFSEAQATRIAQELEAVQRERPDLDAYFRENRLDGFFIKNLENVQGDERDIIIFSIGYGRDEFGKFTLNFGPVNKEGGHRRLNVAITRARQRVEIVTSVLAGDFVGSSKSTGVEHLRRYLAFAERGLVALADTGPVADAEPESPFEESVLGVIRGWGYDAVPQVGQAGYRIDIGIRDPDVPGSFAIGIECDGAAYHSSKVARDRDRLRHEVLEGLGWRLHRVWGPAWYRNRREEQQRLRRAIDNAIAGGLDDASAPAPRPVEVELVEVTTDAPPDWAVTYEIADVWVPHTAGPMHEPSERSRLQKLITDIVVQEGPISVELCMQRAREAWGVGRSGSRIREAFNAIVQNMLTRGVLEEDEDGFVQMPGQELTSVRVPDPDDDRTIRKAAQVPLQELELAIRLLVEASHSITEEDLKVHTARLFGWNRAGVGISAAFNDALAGLLEVDAIERTSEGRLMPANR